ncbi:7SK snRNA methylphosphate capping enzyme-like [Synchiropus picturatus]
MIKMSLEKETIIPLEVPVKVSPSFPSAVSRSEPSHPNKTADFHFKNVLQQTHPAQRVGKKRYSMSFSFKGPAKRRRRANSDSQMEPVLPTNFLLGGNIFDPLNLNSLLDDDVNRVTNQETPQSSPLPSRGGDPVEILIPRDITDPLNLKGEGGDAEDKGGVLLSPLKSRKRHRNRQFGGAARGGGDKEIIPARLFPSTGGLKVPVMTREGSVPVSPLPCELNTAITCRDDVAPPPILPRRHTHPPPGQGPKTCNQSEGRQRKRRRTTSAKCTDSNAVTVNKTTVVQPTKFQTPLVGGARVTRFGGHAGTSQTPERKKNRHRYQFGSHCRYYGYHGSYGGGWEGRVGETEDPRLRLLQADWFRGKKVLDIGCGAGHVTLVVARRFEPTHILGVELDDKLVHAAKQNIRHYMSHDLVEMERSRRCELSSVTTKAAGGRENNMKEVKEETKEESPPKMEVTENELYLSEKSEEMNGVKTEADASEGKTSKMIKDTQQEGKDNVTKANDQLIEELKETMSLLSFPLSFRVSRGPLSAPAVVTAPSTSCQFPNNVTFIQGDYVSMRNMWPGQGHYDVIICLSVTKWVHLQAGDSGVVRLFKRAYHSLLPGGLFILEAQPWSRYSHSKRASETTYRNYRSIRLRPHQFTSYLTETVGFSSYRLIKNTGNQRPIYLFHKGPIHRK